MSEEKKKIEKKADQSEPEVKPAELPEQDLDKVSGGVHSGWDVTQPAKA
jgi:hypothetical protein